MLPEVVGVHILAADLARVLAHVPVQPRQLVSRGVIKNCQ